MEYVRSLLNEYDISQSGDFLFVTDNASNMVKAFENELHLRCACHCLNLAIGQALFINELGETLASCRKLAQHFKQSGLQKFISTTLKQTCVTRWNSTFFMIESFLKNYDEIVGLLATRHEMRFNANLDFELLGELKKFLDVVRNASEELSADETPTLHLVVPWYFKLIKLSKVNASEMEKMKVFKNEFEVNLEKKFHLSSLHYIATFLHPQLKPLPF